MKRKPHLKFWQIWNMSFGFLGIQFGFGLQNANISRIFETLGANVEDIPILWIAAPVTGLIIQPIIGHLSDNTWCRLGRRKPYFLIGAILATIALFIMPNSPMLWVAAGSLWILDASINISMEPFRAFVGDMLPSEQRTKGFAMQSFFIGLGAVVASVLPYIMTNWFNVSNVAAIGEKIPTSVKWSFYLGGIVLLTTVLWTVITTKEYSPKEIKNFEEEKTIEHSGVKQIYNNAEKLLSKFFRGGSISVFIGLLFSYLIFFFSLEKELYVLSFGVAVFGIIQIITGLFTKSGKTKNGLVVIITDLFNMPHTMRQLAVVQFFSWFALFAMWIYSTSAITSHIYGTSDTKTALYNNGADWVGVLFGVYNGFAAVIAFLLPVVAKHTSRKITHMISLILGGISLTSFYFIKDPNLLIIPMLGVGVAWASILSMPYAIVTGSLPSEKMGTYMGIFNFFIVIPQILAASILGFFVKNLFHNNTIYALILGGVSMIVAACCVLFVDDVDAPKKFKNKKIKSI